jgi:hypothetical protein
MTHSGHNAVATATNSASTFMDISHEYGVRINESLSEIQQKINEDKDFRGMRFSAFFPFSVSLTEKTKLKLQQILNEDVKEFSNWTMATAESIFGLLIFASAVSQVSLSAYYYV